MPKELNQIEILKEQTDMYSQEIHFSKITNAQYKGLEIKI